MRFPLLGFVGSAMLMIACSRGNKGEETGTESSASGGASSSSSAHGGASPSSSSSAEGGASPSTSSTSGSSSSSGSSGSSSSGSGSSSSTSTSASSSSSGSTAARGATVPYVEYEAESGVTNGTVIGPSRAINDPNVFNSIAGESSGRQAVKLAGTGQYVRFTTQNTANSVVVRFVIPDSANGDGLQATLGLYVNGSRAATLSLTSVYAWAYGDPVTTDTTTNNPGDGYARHFYDEARVLLPADIPAGATVGVQQDAQDTAAYYVIDLFDLEEVPPALAQPSNAVSVKDYGAQGNGTTDDGQAIQNAINYAQSKGLAVWFPPGTYLDASTVLAIEGVTIYGAGMWLTTLQGASARFVCTGTACSIFNLAILGETVLRDDSASVPGISGLFGTGSQLQNVWIEHTTTGAWIGEPGKTPANGLMIHGARIRDLYADGINFCNGTSGSTVEQSTARNTGDDGIASWSPSADPANTGNTFQFNTVQLPWRANCFAIYGGSNNSIEDSICADVVTYPGILVNQEFTSTTFGGTTTIARDTLLRAGGLFGGQQWGALTVGGNDPAPPVTGVSVANIDIEDATFSGLYFLGPSTAIQGVSLSGVTINAPGTYGISVASNAQGSATATNVVVMSSAMGGLSNAAPSAWTFTRAGGDIGW
jgi:Pectate lyase superfamily protein